MGDAFFMIGTMVVLGGGVIPPPTVHREWETWSAYESAADILMH